MPLSTQATQLLEHILDHGRHDLFPVLADHLEEDGKPVLAKVLRGHTGKQQPFLAPDYSHRYEPELPEPDPRKRPRSPWSTSPYLSDIPDSQVIPDEHQIADFDDEIKHIKSSPELIPGVHLVRNEHLPSGKITHGHYFLHDLRKLNTEDTLPEDYEPQHEFKVRGNQTLDLAKPIPVYEDPGDEVHITGLSKGGNCEHCGKPDIYRIHVKHPISGETCKIGSSCASGMLRDSTKRNLTGKMQPKDILHKAATAESLKDVGSVVKVRLKNKDTKLKLAKGDWSPSSPRVPNFPGKEPGGKLSKVYQVHIKHLVPTEDDQEQEKIYGYSEEMKHGKDEFPPIVVGLSGDRGKLDILDGHHRYFAAKKAGHDYVPVRVYTPPPEDEPHPTDNAGRRIKLARGEEELWPKVNDEHHRLVLADVLEEAGDPLHHVLRNPHEFTTSANLGHMDFFLPHNHPNLHSYGIGVFGKNDQGNHVISLQAKGGDGRSYYGEVSHDQLKDIARKYYDKTKKEGDSPSPRNHVPAKALALSRPDVIADATSKSQDIRKFIAAKIAKEARLKLVSLQEARGNHAAGVVQAYEAPGDEEGVDYAAAWYGLLTNQPSVTTFHESDQGPDTFYKWKVAGDPDEALKTLPPGTIITKDNFAHYLDRGSQKPVDGAPGVRGTAVTMQGRQGYRDFIKRYQGPE